MTDGSLLAGHRRSYSVYTVPAESRADGDGDWELAMDAAFIAPGCDAMRDGTTMATVLSISRIKFSLQLLGGQCYSAHCAAQPTTTA